MSINSDVAHATRRQLEAMDAAEYHGEKWLAGGRAIYGEFLEGEVLERGISWIIQKSHPTPDDRFSIDHNGAIVGMGRTPVGLVINGLKKH